MVSDLKRIAVNAYTAGILDGEGSICIRRHKDKPELHAYYPYIGITNTNTDLINWLQETFGGYAVKRKGRSFVGSTHKDTYDWRLTAAEPIVLFIEKVYTYLI
ncbi:hypothetical protein LCGC14_3024690, partial [marine sediment metagenome]